MNASRPMGVRELDLSNWDTNAVAGGLQRAVPAIKSGTAFLTFLRANLVLDPSTASYANTPVLQPVCSFEPHPSSSPVTDTHPVSLDEVPDITLSILSEPNHKAKALALVAESISQQRQQAALSLVLHPISIILLIGALGLVGHLTKSFRHDLGPILPILVGAVFLASYLLGLYHLTKPYARLAASMSPSFFRLEGGLVVPGSRQTTASPATGILPNDDLILAAHAGTELVAALVLRLEPKLPHIPVGSAGFPPIGSPSSGSGKRRSKGSSGHAGPLRGGKGLVRAWTTSLRWRGRGVGVDLLREAVRVTRERCGRDAEIGFARQHANSMVVLPEVFNRSFRQMERRAAKALDRAVAAWDAARKKR
ncbi:hypothetical protein SODALDRAFT_101493 [Sodiomyces alkalinus F11]|uniref:Uncharacterized protein n=1 Tax=Sodiomyces alkalinus (strain CBS 110278 / VKM F-3762 / F11) TaxID=1314773 RepID=A0A3N2Q1Z6_SODAK|nr:hypothetical protein SODALDRAFT_101493 [Sodiomyces alkalinus F11]ROT40645.1 hypothetical protein SODALDRAFT_101493 [Sodiomyces alkalinus F11]